MKPVVEVLDLPEEANGDPHEDPALDKSDPTLIYKAMASAKKETNFNGEFGWELLKSVPYAHSLHLRGVPLKTISCRDTRCLYYFSSDHEERYQARLMMCGEHWTDPLPFGSIHRREPPNRAYWVPPPYKEHFRGRIAQDRPAVVISNKYNVEWDRPPMNYFSSGALVRMVESLRDRYKVYYNRPTSIVEDNSPTIDLGEKEEVRAAGATLVEDEYQTYKERMTFNEFQMCLMAGCDRFVSVQGGTSILSSYFGGTNLVLARVGQELLYGSYSWYPLLSGCDVRVFGDEEGLVEAAKSY